MATSAIEIDGMACRLGGFTLGPIDARIPRGCVLALIGPNGAGKTTLLDTLMGLGRPNQGAIRILGLDLKRHDVAIKARTAYVNPDLNYATWGSVGKALDFVSGFYPDWDDARCARLLEAFELKRPDKINTLSFGGRIKLSLVMALARDAELLLLDEPTVGLDVNARRVLFQEILDIVRNEDRTVVISSHQLADLERLADMCAVIHKGKLLVMAPMDALLDRYRQVDAIMTAAVPTHPGVRLLARDGDRVRLLIDLSLCPEADFAKLGIAPVADVAMTLEDLFVALTKE